MPIQVPPFSPETHTVSTYTALLKDAYRIDSEMQARFSAATEAEDVSAAARIRAACRHAHDQIEALRSLITTVRATTADEAAVQAAILFGIFDCLVDQVPEDAETPEFERDKAAIERLIFSIMDFLEGQSARSLKDQVNDYFGSPWCNPWTVTGSPLAEGKAK